jgi:two-component system, NarL family, response regulator LiaR
MGMIRILVADDHTMFREGLREMLERQSDFDVVGEAADGIETVRMARDLCPDIVLMDIHMPLLDGIAASRRLTDVSPKSRVIILTMDHEDDSVFEAIRAGAQGYVLKEARTRDLVETVRAVHRGEMGIGRSLAAKVLVEFRRLAEPPAAAVEPVVLSEREKVVLMLICQGASNRDIAAKLALSQQTIKNSLSALYTRLRVNNRAEAAAYALRARLIAGPDTPKG